MRTKSSKYMLALLLATIVPAAMGAWAVVTKDADEPLAIVEATAAASNVERYVSEEVSHASELGEERTSLRLSNVLPIAAGSIAQDIALVPASAPSAMPSETNAALPEFDCLIEPHQVVEVSSPVEGILETVGVERGDFVELNQPLAKLKSGVEEALVRIAEARAQMNGEIKSVKASLDHGRRKLARIDELYAKKAVSFSSKDEAETETIVARMQLRQATENKRLAQLELERAIETLNLRTIASPINGVVVERFKATGESVKDDPILKLAQIDPLNVEVIVPAELFGAVEAGMRADVIPEIATGNAHVATVTIVDRVIDAASGTFGVRLELPNPDHQLPGGLKCGVRFLSE